MANGNGNPNRFEEKEFEEATGPGPTPDQVKAFMQQLALYFEKVGYGTRNVVNQPQDSGNDPDYGSEL